MDVFSEDVKEIYNCLRNTQKQKPKDYTNKEKGLINKFVRGVHLIEIKNKAKENKITVQGDRKILALAEIARASKIEEFTDMVRIFATKSSQVPKTLTFENYGKIELITDWTTIRIGLQEEFRKQKPYARLPDPVTVSEKEYPIEGYVDFIFRYPTKAIIKKWKSIDEAIDKPVSARVRIDKNTLELLVTPPSKRKDGFDTVWSTITKVMKAKETTPDQQKVSELKNNFLETKTVAKRTVFLNINDGQKRKITIEGDGALEFVKTILGDKFQVLNEKFKLIEAVDKDGRKQQF